MDKFNHNFPYYDDDSDYNTNANSYYKYLGRKRKLIKLLAKRIWEYDERLDNRLEELEIVLNDYLSQWDERIDNLDDEVSDIFVTWLNDGTLEQIINHDVLGNKADKAYVDELNENVNEQLTDVDSKHTHISDKEFKANLRAKSHAITFRKPVISWIDDDGTKGVYTKIYPLLKKYGVKMSSAIVGRYRHDFPDDDRDSHPNYITYDEIQEMQKSGHVEFVSHSYLHGGTSSSDLFIDMNENELVDDFETQDKLFKDVNLTRGHFVVPYGAQSPSSLKVVPYYSKNAFLTGSYHSDITSTPIDRTNRYSLPHSPFYLNRISLDNASNELAIRDKLTEGAENNSWVSFISHVDGEDLDMEMMDRLVVYALSLGYEFKTVSEAWNERGHILDLDDSRRKGGKREYNTVITADGEVSGKVLGNYRWAETDEYPNNAPITDFPTGTVTRRKMQYADKDDFDFYAQTRLSPAGGFIETHRDYLDDDFSYERYIETVDPERRIELHRGWDKNNKQWKPWVSLNDPVVGGISSHPNPLTPNSPESDFPKGVTSKIMVSVTNADAWNIPSHGMVEVYRALEDYASYQKLIGTGNKTILYRKWTGEQWGDWETW